MPLFQIPGLDRPGQNGKCIGGLGWKGDTQVAGKQVRVSALAGKLSKVDVVGKLGARATPLSRCCAKEPAGRSAAVTCNSAKAKIYPEVQ